MGHRFVRAIAALALAAFAAATSASAQDAEIERFAQDASFWSVSLSPNGQYIAGIRRDADAERILIVDWRAGQAVALQTAPRESGIDFNSVSWKSDDRLVFSANYSVTFRVGADTGTRLRRRGLDIESSTERIFAIDRTGANLVQMMEAQQSELAARFVSMDVIDRLENDPQHILMATSSRSGLALWRADIVTGVAERVEQGEQDTATWYTDGQGAPVLRLDFLPGNSGWRVLRRAGSRWEQVYEERRAAVEGTPGFAYVGPAPAPGHVYAVARQGNANFQTLHVFDTNTGAFGPALGAEEQADVAQAWIDPRSSELLATCVHRQLYTCRATQPGMQRHLNAINTFFGNASSVTLASMSDDSNVWLVFVEGGTTPPGYYIYDRAQTHIQPIAPIYGSVGEADLAPTEIVNYAGRDGQALWGYLTRRPGASEPQPLVVLPHGGPESRDYYGYDYLVQFLASRGYAVFQPQFRGGEGMGRAFTEAGYRQWGQLMQHDISDGVQHLIASGQVNGQRVCIAGMSYGGYAALAGATLTPDIYRCAVSIAGVSDLPEILRWSREEEGRGSATFSYWQRVIGDPRSDRDMLIANSPARQVARSNVPVLLIHGTTDGIVPIRQSQLMDEAMRRAGKSVRYVVVEGEGHSPSQWDRENRVLLMRELDTFLALHLR